MTHELSWEEMSDGEVQSLRKVVSESFAEFLERFVGGRLDKEPLFDPQDG